MTVLRYESPPTAATTARLSGPADARPLVVSGIGVTGRRTPEQITDDQQAAVDALRRAMPGAVISPARRGPHGGIMGPDVPITAKPGDVLVLTSSTVQHGADMMIATTAWVVPGT